MAAAIRALAYAGLCVFVMLSGASAQSVYDEPIRFIVPAAPGGTADGVTRTIAAEVSEHLGVPVLVENRPGAGGVIATEHAVRLPADGQTIVMVNTSHTTNPFLLESLPYDTLEDLMAVAHTGTIPLALVTHPSTPVGSVEELLALARSDAGPLQYASGGIGSGGHLAGELLAYAVGLELEHVPFQGNAPAVTAVMGGHVPFMFDTVPNSAPQIAAGALKALAVTSRERSGVLPEIPTMIESGVPDFEVSAWIAFIAKAGSPADKITALNEAINKAITDPEVLALPVMSGIEFAATTPEEADAYFRREIELWTNVGLTALTGN